MSLQFGVAAFLLVVNALLVFWARGLLLRAKMKVTRTVFLAGFAAEASIVGSGLFVFFLTDSWTVLYVTILFPPILLTGHATYHW